jgi:hypothetical protein
VRARAAPLALFAHEQRRARQRARRRGVGCFAAASNSRAPPRPAATPRSPHGRPPHHRPLIAASPPPHRPLTASSRLAAPAGSEHELRRGIEERLQTFWKVPRLQLAVQGGRATFAAIVDALRSYCPVVVVRESGGAPARAPRPAPPTLLAAGSAMPSPTAPK